MLPEESVTCTPLTIQCPSSRPAGSHIDSLPDVSTPPPRWALTTCALGPVMKTRTRVIGDVTSDAAKDHVANSSG